MRNKKEVLEELKEKNQVPVGLTTHEAASTLSVSFTTIIAWIKKGKIKCYRTLGGHRRILASEIERVSKLLLGSNEVTAPISDSKPKSVIKPKVSVKPENKSKIPVKPKNKSKLHPMSNPSSKPKFNTLTKEATPKPTKKVSVSKKSSKPINKI